MDWEVKKYPMYYGGVKQVYPNIKPGSPFFSKAISVGNLVFLAGMAGRTIETGDVPSDNFEEQMLVCLDKVKGAMEEAGSSMDNLVKTLIVLRDREHYSLMWKTLLEYYQRHAPHLVEEPPAITVIQIASLAKSHYLVEICAVGVLDRTRPGWEVEKYPMYYGSTKQVYPNIEPGMPFFSESVRVGNLLFLSGVTGEVPATGKVASDILEDQIAAAHDRVRAAMENTGSSMSNIIKTYHFLSSMDYPLPEMKDEHAGYSPATARMWKAELEYFDRYAPSLLDEPPASTFMQARAPGNPDCLITIDVIGVISRDKPGWEVKNYPMYYGMRGFPRHLGDTRMYYASSVAVGNLLFLSGKTGESPYTGRVETDVIEEQMVLALDKLRMAMEEAGSSLQNIIHTIAMLRDLEDYPAMRKTELEYYLKHAPLLTVEPKAGMFNRPFSLATPRLLVQIDAVGVVSAVPSGLYR